MNRYLILILISLFVNLGSVVPGTEARAFFVFGDSLVDNGNNDYLATTARADSYPYGIDYPTHRPTGRFSNGLNIPDIISKFIISICLLCSYASCVVNQCWENVLSGEQIGMEPTLPYLSPQLTGERLLVGANFASAGIGILNDTGFQFVSIVWGINSFVSSTVVCFDVEIAATTSVICSST